MTTPENAQARAVAGARERLLDSGADRLATQPWQHRNQPPADLELVRYAAWAARRADVEPGVLLAGLRLLGEARAELDGIEAALLFAARAAGSTFPELADALGLRSAQAAQQRMTRVSARVDEARR